MRKREVEEDITYLQTMLFYANQVKKKYALVNLDEDSLEQEMFLDSVALMLGQFGEQLDKQKISYNTYIKYKRLYDFDEMKDARHKIYHHYGGLILERLLKYVNDDLPVWETQIRNIIAELEHELETSDREI
ncbi:hypothetical protein SAMN02745116_01718 [Pilibacter termitis]|uniref:DUF86 domain-containing protein n=1 Tax=Pilibacter termitis TaxID=263852 RepID=A0A1T4PA29_9ENTE|nr:hypothetical protein [Pilibacter termitis]SJZ88309.1 hypothetical protein SAMN02745116_01718 [Pilibacter termitis]